MIYTDLDLEVFRSPWYEYVLAMLLGRRFTYKFPKITIWGRYWRGTHYVIWWKRS